MSNCYDAAKVTGCFLPNDGSEKESVLIHTTYNANGEPHSTYATSLESDTPIDPATYKGGGTLVIGECPCITPADFKCLKKRDFRFFYDNGVTPGSSDNDCDARGNFIRFDWTFEVIGWETNVGTLGAGQGIPATTGWTPQLQGWVDFGENNYPIGSPTINHSFSFTPAPTWRAWVIEGCDPTAQFGTWTIRRDDGCIFNVYPRGYEETYSYVWCIDTIDCEGNPSQFFYNRTQNPDTNVVTWEQIEVPENISCFVNCDRELPPVILPGAESECTEKQYNLCDTSVDPQVELIIFVQECPGKDPVVFAHTLEDWTANLTAAEPSPEVPEYDLSKAVLADCETGEIVDLEQKCEDQAIFVKFCPEPDCPPPSIEIYCDSEGGQKYVVVTHANDICGTSGTFLAEAYYADPQVLTPYEIQGIPQICEDSTITDQKCLVDECGNKWTCVTVLNVVNGNTVTSETCVPYVKPEECE